MTKRKELDTTHPATSALYAMANNCWSKKSMSGYFSPDGVRFDAPSGMTRSPGGWRSHSVNGGVVSYYDSVYGGWVKSHAVALENHLKLNPTLIPFRRRKIEEMQGKTYYTGLPGLFIYPPKYPSRPRGKNNRWKIFARGGEDRKLKEFYVAYHLQPGDPSFDKRYMEAANYCSDGIQKRAEMNKYIKSGKN